MCSHTMPCLELLLGKERATMATKNGPRKIGKAHSRSPSTVNGDAEMRGTCSAVFFATNGLAALHGAMDMAG